VTNTATQSADDRRDASRCPLCGEPNRCAIAAGVVDEPCWCTQIELAPGALEALAPDERGKRCLCPRCAASRR
jgi:hypothetical protein